MSITINGTTGVSGVDGSSTTPALQGTDTNTGLFYGTDIVGISTGGSERVRVDASGNVGIGTTSPTSFSGYTVVDAYNGTTGAFFLVRNPTKTGQFVVDTNGVRLGSRTNDFLALTTNDTERMRIDTSGNFTAVIPSGSTSYPAFWCRAWVKFDGTGTVTINGSGNVSSITDNGTGDYTVNFTTAMPDANYSVANTSTGAANDEQRVKILATSASSSPTTYTTSAVRLAGYTSTDYKVVTVSIFR